MLLLVALSAKPASVPSRLCPKAAVPKSSHGYVAGIFSGKGNGFGFGIVDVNTKKEYFMPFFGIHAFLTDQGEQVHAIEVPAGRYRVAYWATYDPVLNEKTCKTDLPDKGPESYFDVKPGRVLALGKFNVSQELRNYRSIEFRVSPQTVTKQEFVVAFFAAYPSFADQPVDFR